MSSSSSSALSWMSTATRSPNISTLRSSFGGQPLERLEPQPRALAAQEARRSGRASPRPPRERPVPEALVARVRADERLRPEARPSPRGPRRRRGRSRAVHLRAVEEKLRRTRERGQVIARRTEEAESHGTDGTWGRARASRAGENASPRPGPGPCLWFAQSRGLCFARRPSLSRLGLTAGLHGRGQGGPGHRRPGGPQARPSRWPTRPPGRASRCATPRAA